MTLLDGGSTLSRALSSSTSTSATTRVGDTSTWNLLDSTSTLTYGTSSQVRDKSTWNLLDSTSTLTYGTSSQNFATTKVWDKSTWNLLDKSSTLAYGTSSQDFATTSVGISSTIDILDSGTSVTYGLSSYTSSVTGIDNSTSTVLDVTTHISETLAKEALRELNRKMTLTALPVIIFVGIISIFGTIGNISVLYVYSQKYPKCNFKYFVLFLAAIDCISCVVVMPLELMTFVQWFVFPAPWLCKFKSFCMAYTVCASAALLLLIAIDRFRKVCRPHDSQIKPELAMKLAFLVLVLSAIPATSDAILWGEHTYNTHYGTIKVKATICEKDDAYKATILPKLHTIVLYAGTNVISMIATLVLYGFIAGKLFCVARPGLDMPKIKITTPESSKGCNTPSATPGNTPGNTPGAFTETTFTFSSDTDQGLSDTEEIEKDNNELKVPVQRQSSGSLVDSEGPSRDSLDLDVVMRRYNFERDANYNSNRNSLDIELSDTRPKMQRYSCEVFENDKKSRDGKIAGVVYRSKSTPSRFLNGLNRRRRRSTIGSMGGSTGARLRRKTLIMWILTIVFIITTVLYFAMISHVADSQDYVSTFTISERAAWLFFLRLYFINSVLNPILYGFLDPRFKRALWNMGVHVSWIAGSLKRNIGRSIRRSVSNSSRSRNEVTVIRRSGVVQRPDTSSVLSSK